MDVRINDLDGNQSVFNLTQVGAVYPDDDIVYIDGVPYVLSTAQTNSQENNTSSWFERGRRVAEEILATQATASLVQLVIRARLHELFSGILHAPEIAEAQALVAQLQEQEPARFCC
jgi:hypothetical protein